MEAATWLRVVSVPAEQESGDEHAQLFAVESLTLVLDTNEVREQVVGKGVATSGDHVVDVVVEFAPGAHYARHIVGREGECEGLEDLVRPKGELFPVLARSADQGTDDGHRVGARDLGDDVAVTPATIGSTISSIISTIVACRRSTARGVNAFATTLRTR